MAEASKALSTFHCAGGLPLVLVRGGGHAHQLLLGREPQQHPHAGVLPALLPARRRRRAHGRVPAGGGSGGGRARQSRGSSI